MWATLALTTALQLAPAQEGTLAIRNVRITHGVLGPERKDNRLLPGDVLVVAFEIEGLQVKDDGRVQYGMGMEMTDSKGEAVFPGKGIQDLEAVNTLGGSTLPAFARAETNPNTAPGEYTLTVTVKDRVSGQTQKLTQKFEVVRARLGLVRFALSYDPPQSMPAPPVAVPGQNLMLNFAMVGFQLDDRKQPHVTVEMRVLDEKGRPTLAKPFVGAIQEVAEGYRALIPWQFLLQINRPGRFQVSIRGTDNITKKSVTETLDLTVNEVK
jgi:hypothetical protein